MANTTKCFILASSLVLVSSLSGLAALPEVDKQADAQRKYVRPYLIRFEGEINPLTEQSFYRKLDLAKSRRADLVVVEIDSPGGWVESSLNLAERLRRVDWARTVAFIPEEAISGGAVMALGCDDILMAPDAHFGDAGEIFRDEKGVFRYVPEKARSYLASRLRVLAQAKGRSPALAEAMCDMDLVVFEVRHNETGAKAFMSDEEINSSENPGQWEKLRPVFGTREKHFLTVNGKEAVELKLAAAQISTRDEVKRHYRLANDFVVLRHTGVDTAVVILNTPVVTGLLIVIGLVALYFEFSFPGTFMGGLIAGLCFALFFWSRFLGGTAGALELILFVAGLVFLAMELFVIPGFGIAGISGIVLILFSIVMASQTFLVPQTGRELNVTLMQVTIVMTASVVFVFAVGLFSHYLGAIPFARSLVLEVPQGEPVVASDKGKEIIGLGLARPGPVQIGDFGTADSPLRPAGKARFGNDFVDVVSDGTFIEIGKRVRVVEVSGNRIVVREVENA